MIALRAAAALLAVLVLGAGSAAAKVTVTSSEIVVSGSGATAVVQRDPFHLSFGSTLAEVPNQSPAPSPLAPTLDPVAPGTEPARSGQLYAPLAYLVGTQTVQQYDGLVWGGNLLSGVRSGVQYAARRVTAVASRGAGISLTLATDELGRTLELDVEPAGPGLISVSVTPHPSGGVALMSDSFASPAGEAFHGFGGRHDGVDQRGQNLASFVEEENLPGPPGTSIPAGSSATVLFPNGPTAAYYPQAQFVSSRGYGFLLDQPQLAWFRLDSDRGEAWSVAADAPSLHYVVAPGRAGRPAVALAALTRRTGRQPAPPAWALGPMLDRLVKNVGETEADYEANLEDDLANIARYRLPLKAYRIEGWGLPGTGNDGLALHSFVAPVVQARVIAALRRRHIHPLAYLRPWITPGSAPDQQGLAARTAGGGTYVTTSTTGARIALLDFTNPAAVAFWRREVARTLDLGFDGFMADFGEEVVAGMHFHDGETGATMHNLYPVLYMRATRAAVTAYERAHPGRRIWFFNRAGYTGSAAYEGGNFPGDEVTDWGQAAGLASLAPDMLNRAVGGAYGFATDIGGYYDITTPKTTKELFLRWAEWAALTPVFRLHGSGLAGTHTPWSFDRQTVRVYNRLSRLHEQAAGLILRLWRQSDRTGIPPTRPLWLEFPGDRRAASVQQEWTLGGDVLVTPVVTQGATTLRAYFPRGCWRDPQTRVTERGPRTATVAAPLTRLDFFFRCGTRPFRVRQWPVRSSRSRRRSRARSRRPA